MVNTKAIVSGLKIAGKATLSLALGLAGAEVFCVGTQLAVNDAVYVSKKAPKPIVVKTSGIGPWKKVTVMTQNIFTGEKYYTTVKASQIKVAGKKAK